MKSVIATAFAAALLCATAASAQVGVGVHVGGAHVGVGIHTHHTYHRPYHPAARHCWWRNHHRICR